MSGFDLNQGSNFRRSFDDDSASQQLSLLDQPQNNLFGGSRLDLEFVENNQSYDNSDLHLLANMSQDPEGSPKYFAYSTFLHVALALSTIFIQLPKFETPQVETITVELEEPTPELLRELKVAKGEDVAPTKGATRPEEASLNNATSKVQAPKTDEISDDRIVVAAKKSPKSKSPVARARTYTGGGKAKIATQAPSRAGVPESLEDIAAPKLDDGVDFSQVGKLGENEFEDEFKNVDHASAASVKALKNSMDDELRQIADEKDEELKAMEDENKAFAHQVDQENKARRMKDAQAIAAAQAAEHAAIERAAQNAAKAEALRKARESALAAQAAALGNGSTSRGQGSGNVGEDRPSQKVAGDPNGVRSLDQLRQMPGNPRPQYSTEERLQRHQGEIVMHAYVTKEGQLTNFKLLKATGYRSLDAKTLAALKKWRFYPGQQGWVELPFRWDLKGGIQEVPTYLRRKK